MKKYSSGVPKKKNIIYLSFSTKYIHSKVNFKREIEKS